MHYTKKSFLTAAALAVTGCVQPVTAQAQSPAVCEAQLKHALSDMLATARSHSNSAAAADALSDTLAALNNPHHQRNQLSVSLFNRYLRPTCLDVLIAPDCLPYADQRIHQLPAKGNYSTPSF